MDMASEMMGDAVDDALDDDEVEDETDDLMNQVCSYSNCLYVFMYYALSSYQLLQQHSLPHGPKNTSNKLIKSAQADSEHAGFG